MVLFELLRILVFAFPIRTKRLWPVRLAAVTVSVVNARIVKARTACARVSQSVIAVTFSWHSAHSSACGAGFARCHSRSAHLRKAVAWLTTHEMDFPKVCPLVRLRIRTLAKANPGKTGSKGRQLVHGRPLLMVRHFLRSTEHHKLLSKNFEWENCQN